MISGLTKIQHGFDEILAIHAKYPRNTDKEELLQRFHCQFTLILSLTIDIQRLSFIIRFPWSGSLAVEHIIRADVHHFTV